MVIEKSSKKKPATVITYTGKGHKFKLRGKFIKPKDKAQRQTISLYIEAYLGSHKTPDGKIKTQKAYEFLGLHIFKNPQTEQEKESNKEIIKLADKIRAKREEEFNHVSEGFQAPSKKKINFIDYYKAFVDSYTNKDLRIVKYSYEHFKKYVSEIKQKGKTPPDPVAKRKNPTSREKTYFILPSEITPDFVKGFVNYLNENLNGETPYNYFTKFKKLCKKATKEGVFYNNPADDITISRPGGVKKEILSFNEIQALATAYCGNEEVKQAFLFCLNTGLRHVDVKGLQWKNIDFENRILKKLQSKVKNSSVSPYVYIDLNNNAFTILKKRNSNQKPNDYIFKLPSITGSLKIIKNWAARAGIQKNITWHSGRHSFATNLLMSNTDIKTVSGLLGHSGLKHTEKYTHLVNELKRKAVDSLQDINY